MEQIRELVVRAASAVRQNDRIDAFAKLMELFRDMACGYAYSILGDFHLAEDAAQDAFVTAYRTLEQLREPEAFPGWFRRIVWTECAQMARKKALPVVGIEAASEMPSNAATPSAAVENTEMRDEVIRAICGLPDQQCSVSSTMFNILSLSRLRDAFSRFLTVPTGTSKKSAMSFWE